MEKEEGQLIDHNIKERVLLAVEDKTEMPSTRLLLSNYVEQKRYCLEFNEAELTWLRYKIEFIPFILDSDVCSGVIYWLKTDAGTNPYAIAKKLGVYARSTYYWSKKLINEGLIICHPRTEGFGNSDRYYLNKKFSNILSLLIDLIEKTHGFAGFHKNSRNKQWEYLREYRKKNK